MSDQSLFQENSNTQETPEALTPVQTSSNLFADQLSSIKNESGEQKYDSPEKALEALKHSQQYIPQLKSELTSAQEEIQNLKVKLEASKSVEELITSQTNPQVSEPTSPQSTSGEDNLVELVNKAIAEREAVSAEQGNVQAVTEALKSKFGDNAQEEVVKKAKELGVSPVDLEQLSKKSPKAALALFGEQIGSASPTTNSINISATPAPVESLKRPEKSLLAGSTAREQAEFMRKIKEEVYREYNVQE